MCILCSIPIVEETIFSPFNYLYAFVKNQLAGWMWCYIPVIPATEEAETAGLWFEAGPDVPFPPN
jgi:hypothetical protein